MMYNRLALFFKIFPCFMFRGCFFSYWFANRWLSITGKLISKEQSAQCLFVRQDVGFFVGKLVNIGKLRAHFKDMPMDSEESVLYANRANILYLLGSFSFKTIGTNIVSFSDLPFLEDLGKVNDYAWGSAVLAYLLPSLRTLKKKKTADVGGFLYIFMGSTNLMFFEFAISIYIIAKSKY